ncbi:MAG: SDR family oxidoreductase [Bacteroidales bacterium]|nr:SDR family oxidoreductase [Bacteroidales bacterium]
MGIAYNPFSLENKTILVTGASSGIGQATAIECSKIGARVVITGRNPERLQQTFSQLEGDGHIQIVADLTEDSDIERLAGDVPELDGLVNNAGIGHTSLVRFIKKEDIEKVFMTNEFAPMLLTKSLLKKKKITRGASLVFTASIAAFSNALGNSLYSASKAGICAFMRSCAKELADKKIRANAICPGMVETKLIRGGALSEDDLSKDMEKYPLKRYGRPEEIAFAAIYLLSDAASWITGTSLVIDGGKLLK